MWLILTLCTHVFFLPVKDDTPERWNGRQATDKEMQAATVLQAGWKGYLVRESSLQQDQVKSSFSWNRDNDTW